jgi:hypothetical protein
MFSIINENQSFHQGVLRARADLNAHKQYNPCGHGIKITSLKSYSYMMEEEAGYRSVFSPVK